MDVPQASIEKGKGRLCHRLCLPPGQTNIRLSYELPYPESSSHGEVACRLSWDEASVVVAPAASHVTGEGLTAAGQEQGMIVFPHEPLAR